MKEFNRKYLEDSLDLSELKELRAVLDNAETGEVEQLMLDSWKEECLKDYDSSTAQSRRMIRKIDRKVRNETVRKPLWGLIGWGCCAALALALIFSNAFNVRKIWELTSQDVIIKTSDGEKSTVVLPDGSKVNLNYGSRLVYNQAQFIRGKRNVEFSGEAYFDINKQNGMPFVINSKDLSVIVTGTKFNYINRSSNNVSTLALFEGRVSLVSGKDNKMTEVSPGQIATYTKSTGMFELKSSDYIESMSAWTRGEIVFRRATLARVLEILGHYYGYKVTASSQIKNLHNTFSGTLPLSDINDAMTVLELLYPINTVILDDRITVSMNK